MTIRKSELIKITLDMPIKDFYNYNNEETVGDFLKALGKYGGHTFAHKGIEYYLDSWNGCSEFKEIAFQVNSNNVANCPEYVQLFFDKENNFFQFIQYARYLDGTFVYEDIIDWEKVKNYETFKPDWLN